MLEKGIAIHHSGVTPIFREMIELLFKKMHTIVVATETFAVGINMPASVVFTTLKKYTQNGYRLLFHMNTRKWLEERVSVELIKLGIFII